MDDRPQDDEIPPPGLAIASRIFAGLLLLAAAIVGQWAVAAVDTDMGGEARAVFGLRSVKIVQGKDPTWLTVVDSSIAEVEGHDEAVATTKALGWLVTALLSAAMLGCGIALVESRGDRRLSWAAPAATGALAALAAVGFAYVKSGLVPEIAEQWGSFSVYVRQGSSSTFPGFSYWMVLLALVFGGVGWAVQVTGLKEALRARRKAAERAARHGH